MDTEALRVRYIDRYGPDIFADLHTLSDAIVQEKYNLSKGAPCKIRARFGIRQQGERPVTTRHAVHRVYVRLPKPLAELSDEEAAQCWQEALAAARKVDKVRR